MDKHEVITLSSDDETETTDRVEKNLNATVIIKSGCKNSQKLNRNTVIKNPGLIIRNNKEVKKPKVDKQCEITSNDSPEVVDLVDFLDKLDEDVSSESEQDSELDIIDIDEISNKNDSSHDEKTKRSQRKKLSSSEIESNQGKVTSESISSTANSSNETVGFKSELCTNEEFNQNLKCFTEFVDYCGSLEKIPNDRVRLTRKLMKQYGEADCSYIKSQEFRYLIQKCRDKVTKNNLYLIAKEITEELSYKKKITTNRDRSKLTKEKSQRDVPEYNEETEDTSIKLTKKRARFINKIVKKLDKLGSKIQELEEQEVDLSDEEDSTYVLLQRYRERFCQIYKRLCAYTNQIPDPNNRKICFTESKYPAINKCIEKWLNKTKRFPDFSDIMKLLESQSSSLGLPSNRELVRSIAVEIFQKVGVMLQRRRIYDLWDIFCGFLDDGKDPADSDPILDQTLKNNFETRLKKEQDIFQHFAELQEKEKLEPEEVTDEEANYSPVESGNEDDKEIEEIENCLNKRVDDVIKNGEDNGNILENKDYDGNGNNSENDAEPVPPKQEYTAKSKETKNNYRNCKSLKWRQENSGKSKSDTSNSEDSSTGTENDKEKPENGVNVTKDRSEENVINDKPEEVGKNDSDLELIAEEDAKEENNEIKPVVTCNTFCKRVASRKIESPSPKKKKYPSGVEVDDFDVFEIDDENGKTNEVFGVHCCQIFPDNVFQDFGEEKKDWNKRKVFKDLTNVNRLMELHGKKKKMSGLFSPSFFHQSFCEFEKSSWKKRFKVSFRLVGSNNQKCGLNQDEKSTKIMNSDSGGDSDEKDIHSNSEGGADDEGDNFFRSHGNGREEDNNEDENKKSRGTDDEINDNQHQEEEEDDDEEEEEIKNEKTDNIINTEPLKQFLSVPKTEETPDCDQDNKTPFKFEICFNEKEEEKAIQLSFKKTETPGPDLRLESAERLEKTDANDDEKAEEKRGPEEESTEATSEEPIEINKDKEKPKVKKKKKKKKNKKSNGGTTKDQNEEIATQNSTTEEAPIEEVKKNMERTDIQNKNDENTEGQSEETMTQNGVTEEVVCEDLKANVEEMEENKSKKIVDKQRVTDTEVKGKPVTLKELKNYVENPRLKAEQETKNKKPGTVSPETIEVEPTIWQSIQPDFPTKKLHKRNLSSTSDEERVRRFLMHSPSSISITPPKKLALSKPPSQTALQALATLRNLKGISTTVVRSKPRKEDDIIVIEGSTKRQSDQDPNPSKRRRSDLPVISSVHSMAATPTIVTVQGNVSGFEELVSGNGDSECDSSSIRIFGGFAWGNLPNNYIPIPKMESVSPGCSSRQPKQSGKAGRKKNSKKAVEYVVLE